MNNKQSNLLTASEKEVLDLLWNCEQPLTSSEIVQHSKDCRWKPSYIHLMLTSLLKKEAIVIAGFRQTTKNYARTFSPAMTREEFYLKELMESYPVTDESMITMAKHALNHMEDPENIDRIIALCKKRKEALST